MKKLFFRMMCVILLCVFMFAIGKLYMDIADRNASNSTYRSSKEEFEKIMNIDKAKFDKNLNYETQFKEFSNGNEDIVGYIVIDGTRISYPVLQASDNLFYLNHDAGKNSSSRGSIMMDCNNNETIFDTNTVLYGHYTEDGSMFGELKNYREESFYNKNSEIRYYSSLNESKWEIFSVSLTVSNEGYHQINFTSEENYQRFLDERKELSLYDTGVEVTTNDKIITLSTCAYDFENARLVIQGKLIE